MWLSKDKHPFYAGQKINKIIGKTVSDFFVSENMNFVEVEFSDGSFLRVDPFTDGGRISDGVVLASFGESRVDGVLETNVQAHPRASKDSETTKDALRPLGEATCSAVDSTVDVGSEGLGSASLDKEVSEAILSIIREENRSMRLKNPSPWK